MKILIPTIGSRGDVQPFIALAQGLIRAGHSVTLATHPMMKPLVQSYGLSFAPIGPDIDLAQEVASIRQNSRSAAVGLIRGMRFSFDMLERSHNDILALCGGADLAVVSAQSAAGKNEADLLSLPYLSVTLMPWAIPWDDPQRPLLKRALYSLINGLAALITTRPLNRIRKGLGLPPAGKEGFTSTRLNLVPVSPAVYEPNPRWEPHHSMVGYWYTEDSGDWQPPVELSAFLEAGEPPILVSLGAMSLGEANPRQVASLFVNAIQGAGVRAVIQGWEAEIEQLTLPETISAAGSLPHSWLLPRCSAVVHHGGYGTTAAGLRAGIPALLIPHIADQFFWGDIIHKLGVGPKPLRRAKLSLDSLTTSIRELVYNQGYCPAAKSIGEVIQAESGIENAVRLIEEVFIEGI